MKTTNLACAIMLGLASTTGAIQAQEAAKPTPEHLELAKEVGTWDAEIKVWMQGPDAPPETTKGEERISLLPGGLWLTSEFKGEMGGKDFHGRGLSGYDPAKKKYVDVWIDSTDPHVTTLEGEYDEATKTLTSHGKSIDPHSGSPYDIKTESVRKGPDLRVFTFHIKNKDTGGEYLKILEMTYKRRGE